MSIDFFASNTSLSDYQKNENFFPKGHEPKDVGMEISMPNHMHLYISFYRDEQRAKALDRIMLTFIENKYNEIKEMIKKKEKEGMGLGYEEYI